MVPLLPYMSKETENIQVTVVMDTLDHTVNRYKSTTTTNTSTKKMKKISYLFILYKVKGYNARFDWLKVVEYMPNNVIVFLTNCINFCHSRDSTMKTFSNPSPCNCLFPVTVYLPTVYNNGTCPFNLSCSRLKDEVQDWYLVTRIWNPMIRPACEVKLLYYHWFDGFICGILSKQ